MILLSWVAYHETSTSLSGVRSGSAVLPNHASKNHPSKHDNVGASKVQYRGVKTVCKEHRQERKRYLIKKIFGYGESNPELPRSGTTPMRGGNVSRYTISDR
jgi:hypothetical protein